MPMLLMETDQARNTQQELVQLVAGVNEKTQLISHSTQQLVGVWEGNACNLFADEMQQIMQVMQTLSEEVSELATRLQNEITEWEEVAAAFGGGAVGGGAVGGAISGAGAGGMHFDPNSGVIGPIGTGSAPLTNSAAGAIGGNNGGASDKESGIFSPKIDPQGKLFEYDHKNKTGEKFTPGFNLKGQVVKGSLWSHENSNDKNDMVALGEASAGLSFGNDLKGTAKENFTVGAWGEAYSAKAQGDAVLLGDDDFGLTVDGEAKGPGVEGFIGLKDGTLGGTIGGTLVSAKGGVGTNIAGYNVGVNGEIGLKAEIGLTLGKETEIKLPFVSIGFSFGGARK